MIVKQKSAKSIRLGRTATALTASLVCFASANAQAQVSNTRTSDGAMISQTAPKANSVVPDAQATGEEALAAGSTVIYSNLGTGNSVYNAGTGYTEAGQEANDEAIAEAMSFTPVSSYILLRIDGAFTYVTGTNGTRLVLAEDNGGVPGKIIYVATFRNLPTFGTCCTIQTVKLTPTKTSYVALQGGLKYWLYPLPLDTTGYLVWNYDTTSKGGDGAVSHDYGKSWTPAALTPFGTFDLYGSKLAQ